MKFLKDFAFFWYEFIIGDDWKIAVAVVAAVGVTALLLTQKVFGDHVLAVVGAVLIVICFSISLAIDVHGNE
jgi:hypothetical protein